MFRFRLASNLRRGFSLIELLAAIGIIGVLLAIALPAVQAARESSRRAECQNNLRQLGLALANYNAAHGTFPPGQCVGSYLDLPDVATKKVGSLRVYANGLAMLLPFLELSSLDYDYDKPWDDQASATLSTRLPALVCPTNDDSANPQRFPGMSGFFQAGIECAITDYVMCKGVYDGWCLFPGLISRDARGMFDASGPRELPFAGVSFACKAPTISDGLSNTFAMGEGAGGPSWPLCKGPQCTSAYPNVYKPGSGQFADNPWAAQPSYDEFANVGMLYSSAFAATIEPLNKRPVTHTVVFAGTLTNLLNCGTSFDWNNKGAPTGPHQTSNFRSDHPGGGQFVMADGSVQFMQSGIDLNVYRSLSTIAESQPDDLPAFPVIVVD